MATSVVRRARPEERARDILLEFYRHLKRDSGVGPNASEFFPVAVERIAKEVLGWQIEVVTGDVGTSFARGGELIGPQHGEADFTRKIITVTLRTGGEARKRFSVAHELGHVVLHSQASQKVLSRTRLVSSRPGIGTRAVNSPVPLEQRLEREANIFATALLMPEKAIRDNFRELFGVGRLSIDSEQAFALSSGSGRTPRKTLGKTAEMLARERVHPDQPSLADFFGVSAEAMAVRMCELRLVQ